MNSKRTPIIVGVTLVLVLAALFMIPRLTDPTRGLAALWKAAGVDCLTMGHSRVLQHFHPHLEIIVDGREEPIPANIGVLRDCMSEVHTHDGAGTIHVEAASGDKSFYLKDFFAVYGKELNRTGYLLTATADGQPVSDAANLLLQDKQIIILEYKSAQ